MKISSIWWLPLLSVAAACGGSGSSGGAGNQGVSATTSSEPSLPDDAAIVTLLYNNSYSVPDGFYVDERANTERSYALHHVLDDTGSFELCTDDFALAMAWEENDNAARSVQGYFVDSYENSRYFEFARELSYQDDVGNIDDITSPGFARVFKCRHTSRDGVDRSLLAGYAGTINAQPVDADSIRLFSEYLWQFTFFPNSRKKVIESSPSSTNETFDHTLVLAFSTNQGVDKCDLIEVVEWRFSANRTTGVVSKEFDLRRSFEARYEAGSAAICN